MKSHLVYFLLSLHLGSLCAIAQGPSAKKNGQLSPEMQKLFNVFLGTWSVTEEIEPNERLPKGGVGEGEEVYRAGPGAGSPNRPFATAESTAASRVHFSSLELLLPSDTVLDYCRLDRPDGNGFAP